MPNDDWMDEVGPIRLGDEPPQQVRWEFGPHCYREEWLEEPEGQWTRQERVLFARDVRPSATMRVHGAGDYGMVYDYRDQRGRVLQGTLLASAWAGGGSGPAGVAMRAGVQVLPGCGRLWTRAMGTWHSHAVDAPEVTVVEASGWHQDGEHHVYVNGGTVIGAEWLAEGAHVDLRGLKRGTLGEWKDVTSQLLTTPFLKFVVGVSLAGPLPKILDRDSFGAHLAGPSSSGKSLGLYPAASVWSEPRSAIGSWHGTRSSHENDAAISSGACFIRDEVQQCDPADVRQVIYTLAHGSGRGRANSSGWSNQQSTTWSCTSLSTGENTMQEWVGVRNVQGGMTVRMLDIPIVRGDITTDAAHAAALRREFGRHYGLAGEALVRHLLGLDWDDLRARYEAIVQDLAREVDDGENVRICEQLAMVQLALLLAHEADLMPFDTEELEASVQAVRDRVFEHRGGTTTPEARAWDALKSSVSTAPARWPSEGEYAQANAAYGIRDAVAGVIYTTPKMLSESRLCESVGCRPDQLLTWLEAEGLCQRPDGSTRKGGRKQRWYVVWVDRESETDIAPSDLDSNDVDAADAEPTGNGQAHEPPKRANGQSKPEIPDLSAFWRT